MSAADGSEPSNFRPVPPGRRLFGFRPAGASGRDALRDADMSGIGAWLRRQVEVERQARSAFALIPVGMIAGVAAFHGGDYRPSAASFLFVGALLLAAIAVVRPAFRALAVFLLSALAAMGLAGVELARTQTTIFSGEATVRIEGRVAWRDRDERGRYRYVIDLTGTERPTLSRPPERVRILVSSRHEALPIGATYRGLVRLRPPSGPAAPGSYDFAFAPYFQGLGAYGFSLGAPDAVGEAATDVLSPGERVAALRLAIGERVRSTLPGAEGAVAAALIMGERAGIPDEIDEALRATGLAHVLSISGFHMALVAGFTMAAIRALLSLVPGAALLLPTKKIAAGVALAASTLYLLLAGGNVATERSYIMLVIMLAAVMADRPALTLRNVALAAVVLIAAKPHTVMTASFQMSFAATAALVGAYGSYARWQAGRPEAERQPRRRARAVLLLVAGLALSSLIAGLATGPFAAYHFQRIAPFGLLANIVAMPLFSFWIMPLCLLSVLAMPFGLEQPLLMLLGLGLTAVFELALLFAAWFPDRPSGAITATALVLLAGSVLALSFFASGLRWTALPLALAGLLLSPVRTPLPELLVFEDGKELALVADDGSLTHRKAKPSDFIADQWDRMFLGPANAVSGDPAFRGVAATAAIPAFRCEADVCRARTRSGLRIVWTDDYEKTGQACEEADVAIVARAIRQTSCRSGAHLVTLRTLRRTGSLALSRSAETGEAVLTPSIPEAPREWNAHRHAPWPEYWRNPANDSADPANDPAEPVTIGD